MLEPIRVVTLTYNSTSHVEKSSSVIEADKPMEKFLASVSTLVFIILFSIEFDVIALPFRKALLP